MLFGGWYFSIFGGKLKSLYINEYASLCIMITQSTQATLGGCQNNSELFYSKKGLKSCKEWIEGTDF